jgi:hypothetical protein
MGAGRERKVRQCRDQARRRRDQVTDLSDKPGKVTRLFAVVPHRDHRFDKHSSVEECRFQEGQQEATMIA